MPRSYVLVTTKAYNQTRFTDTATVHVADDDNMEALSRISWVLGAVVVAAQKGVPGSQSPAQINGTDMQQSARIYTLPEPNCRKLFLFFP